MNEITTEAPGAATDTRDTLLLSGGAALLVLGAGMVLSHPAIRRSAQAALGALLPELEKPLKDGVRNVLPDVERYLRLRGM